MQTPLGQLVAQDEMFCHQTQETFATVATTDPSWTERAYGCVIAQNDAFALHWGLGKYTNRNVMDGFAGIGVQRVQRNVRFSRRLAPAVNALAVGPFRYEVIEPLKDTRSVLEASQHQPIAFDIVQEVIDVPWLEDRSYVWRGLRRVQDEVRYILCCRASGWVEFDGHRIELDPATTFGFRDHSWGIKQNTGEPAHDAPERGRMPAGVKYRMVWVPCVLARPDGSVYRVHLFTWESHSRHGHHVVNESRIFATGGTLHSEETKVALDYDPANREVLGGTITLTMADGSRRLFGIEVSGQSRVCLGAGLYNTYKGHYHGEARGLLHVEGECIANTADPQICREVHQLRDVLVRVTDPAGGASGWGILNSEIVGAWPELGLGDEHWR